jgi:hypothetical protein
MPMRFRPSGPHLIGREIAAAILAFACAGLAGYGAMHASAVWLGFRGQAAVWAGAIAFIAVLVLGSLAIDAMHHKRLG